MEAIAKTIARGNDAFGTVKYAPTSFLIDQYEKVKNREKLQIIGDAINSVIPGGGYGLKNPRSNIPTPIYPPTSKPPLPKRRRLSKSKSRKQDILDTAMDILSGGQSITELANMPGDKYHEIVETELRRRGVLK